MLYISVVIVDKIPAVTTPTIGIIG